MDYIITDIDLSTKAKNKEVVKVASFCDSGREIVAKYELAGTYTKSQLVEKLIAIGPVFEEREAIRIARFCKKNGMFAILKSVYDVADVWQQLKDREVNPSGHFDSAGRFYSDFDGLSEGVRSPSRAHPYSEMVACRTEIYAMACALANRSV